MQLTPINIIHHEPITLSDGTVLSAMIWLPKDAKSQPVPAILEYLPYRKRDGTAVRDAMNHPYVAGHGYACVRVDIRGTGESQGVLRGEYLPQEQDDALEILQWIAAQRWCTGSIGMIGISWGGFNGLQVAARQPPELKAVISICSTDKRYDDDIHYMGGCILTENFTWAASMFAINSSPPDPAVIEDQWRDLWLKRLNSGGFYAKEWHEHQRQDNFWKHASIGEDYSSIQCPVYVVGGWMDPYTNTIFRMLENLKVPRKGLVGPWGHKYPNFGYPGPQIGFLQESIRWWDKWLKNTETGIMDEPMLRCYLQDTARPAAYLESRPGRWVAEDNWSDTKCSWRRLGLSPGRLTDCESVCDEKLDICSPQTVGFAGGRWLIFGIEGEGPGDQRLEAGGSLLFETQPLVEPKDFLGPPILNLRVSSNKPNALVAATLSEVLPDGAATKISHGVLNLTHRHGHEDVRPLEPGRFYDVTLKLNHFGQRIGTGSRFRLALSSTYFPMVWPSPEVTTLTVDCAHSGLDLPERSHNPRDSQLKPFKPAVNGSLPQVELRPAKHRNFVSQDWDSGETALCVDWDDGMWEISETGWRYGWWTGTKASVHPDDPLSAQVEQQFERDFERGEIVLKTKGWTRMKMTATDMIITARLDAYEQGYHFRSIGFMKQNISVPNAFSPFIQVPAQLKVVLSGLRTRWPIIIFGILLLLTGTIILSVAMSPNGNLGLVMTAWILCFLETGVSGLYMTWINEVCSYSFEHRAIIIAVADTMAFASNAWMPLLTFNTGEAPYFTIGYKMSAIFFSVQILFTLAIPLAQKHWRVGKYEMP